MKNMKSLLGFYALAAMAASYESVGNRVQEYEPTKRNTEPPKPKNHKRFVIDGIEVWALSEKRAIEKLKKSSKCTGK